MSIRAKDMLASMGDDDEGGGRGSNGSPNGSRPTNGVFNGTAVEAADSSVHEGEVSASYEPWELLECRCMHRWDAEKLLYCRLSPMQATVCRSFCSTLL